MLKPGEPDPAGNGGAEERPVGELVHRLVEDGKAYAKAELDVAKAIAAAKADGLKLPLILFAAAFLFLQAAVVLLGMTVYATLVSRLGPFLAGLIATILMLAIAGGLANYAVKRLKALP